MGFLRNLFGKKEPKQADKKEIRKYGSDGYLLPEYWQCIICKAGKVDQKATRATFPSLFFKAIEDERFFKELDQTERAAANNYAHYISDPQGALLERPPGTEDLEDTAGLARKRDGTGFDAVYLCDAHYDEMMQAI